MSIHTVSSNDRYLNPTIEKIKFLNNKFKLFINDILKIKDEQFLVVGREVTILKQVVWNIKKIK